MNRAPVQTLSSFQPKPEWKGRDVCVAASQVDKVYRILMSEALLGSGFYHGDLHSGNMLFHFTQHDYDRKQTVVLTLLDFGNTGTIENHALTIPILRIVLGSLVNSADTIMAGVGRTPAN